MAQSLPFVRDVYQPNLRLADLLLQSGRDAAEAERRRGDIAAQAWNNVGQTIAGIPQQIQANKSQQERAQFNALQRRQVEGELSDADAARATASNRAQAYQSGGRAAVLKALEGDPEGYDRATKHFQSIDDSFNGLIGTAAAGVRAFKDDPRAAMAALDDLAEQGMDPQKLQPIRMQIVEHPESLTPLIDSLLQKSPHSEHHALVTKADKTPEAFTLGPGQTRFGPAGETVASVPASEPKPEKEPTPTEASLAAAAARGDKSAKAALDLLRQQREKDKPDEPLQAIIGPDGQSILVPRSQAVGKRPANAREQGRPVTSGDAGRLTELQTSLDDLKRLTTSLGASGATGATSKVGALLPNVVTEYTGWGEDAKKKQAMIDRVKQVIGKALEGGVLRKEDELKYEKILPTIGDPAPIVTEKLKGLEAAIAQRKDRTLEALSDAGYDIGKYQQRQDQKTDETWERGPDGKLRKKGS